jgi:hypothetical protein
MHLPRIKQRFLEQLKNLKQLILPKNQYLIWGSGPLAIREIRDSQDIDLIISNQLWKSLIHDYPLSSKNMIRIGNIEIWQDCLNLSYKIEDMVSHPDIIENFPFMTLSDTIEWKKFMNREKDLKDIALIQDYLKTV